MTTFDNVYGVPVYWTYTPGRKPAYCTFFLDADKVIEISISVEKWGILVGGQRNSTLRITNTSGGPDDTTIEKIRSFERKNDIPDGLVVPVAEYFWEEIFIG